MWRVLAPVCALSIGACALSSGTANRGARDQVAYERAAQAIGQENTLKDTDGALCESVSEGVSTTVRYIGHTDEHLLRCVIRFSKVRAATWIITSPGGITDFAIAAAYIFKMRQWDIEVVGQCTSSCANYLLPAARGVTVAKYSLVLLHGAPTLLSKQEIEANVRGELSKWQPDASDQQIADIVADTEDQSRSAFAVHADAARALGVGRLWYDFQPNSPSLHAVSTGRKGPLLIADLAMFESCSPRHTRVQYWDPVSEGDWEVVRELFPNVTLLHRADTGPFRCH